MERLVIALGGNALQFGKERSYAEQLSRANSAFKNMAPVISARETVITHGNGPQVGDILLQNEATKKEVPQMPLDACGSMSQGLIAQILTTASYNSLSGINRPAVQIFTRTIVSASDPAFADPSKFIGPTYRKEEADELLRVRGWKMKEQNGKGWRRVVASPEPVDILEWKTVVDLLENNYLPICTGGGGTPMVIEGGQLKGVEAVIDKDLASSLLANKIGAEEFVILTDVENVYVDYMQESQRSISTTTVREMEEYFKQGKFQAGSMGPKVKAALNFLRKGGKEVVITSLEKAKQGVIGGTGTHIFRN
ncbi:MAG: carbamate kinase [Candidatus Thermoplasmatota archaeon]|jgi:carbamate kinase|nr:carbamate kinase [Candidatus Thermoplasmatota archaeon]